MADGHETDGLLKRRTGSSDTPPDMECPRQNDEQRVDPCPILHLRRPEFQNKGKRVRSISESTDIVGLLFGATKNLKKKLRNIKVIIDLEKRWKKLKSQNVNYKNPSCTAVSRSALVIRHLFIMTKYERQ